MTKAGREKKGNNDDIWNRKRKDNSQATGKKQTYPLRRERSETVLRQECTRNSSREDQLVIKKTSQEILKSETC